LAKCAICGKRKGHRSCKIAGGMSCSLCCGLHRKKEACQDCTYYRDVPPHQDVPSTPVRDYNKVPRYSPETMNADLDLQTYSNSIESALCLWDQEMNGMLTDAAALSVLERLLDKYHFKDDTLDDFQGPVRRGQQIVQSAIDADLADIPNDKIVKILGAIHFVARRRARGGRDYFDVIHRYVGVRLGPGLRTFHVNR
jgi:hypothetical protein